MLSIEAVDKSEREEIKLQSGFRIAQFHIFIMFEIIFLRLILIEL